MSHTDPPTDPIGPLMDVLGAPRPCRIPAATPW
jgi:hypothetical protein